MPGNSNSGARAERLPAADTARARKWASGSVIKSKDWSGQLVIVSIEDKFVKVRRQAPGNGVKGPVDRVRSFPTDVTRVGPEEKL
jgi:hypothetical protein